ncbi:MAG: sigma-70 family RNA polymerase sigma factor [Planctomycetes bacterium]|nr:sigma-70 family RNA polymerase sigma factor [Planctomycetota bacterium]
MDFSPDDLVGRASRGEAPAIDELIARVLPDLRRYVRIRLGPLVAARESASDIVQSTCRELFTGLAQFEYRGWASFRHWLFQAAVRKIVQRQRYYEAERRDVKRVEAEPAPDDALGSGTPTPSHEAMAHETEERLLLALDHLNDAERAQYAAFFVLGMTPHEVAEEQGITFEAARKQRSRLVAKLAHLMERGSG